MSRPTDRTNGDMNTPRRIWDAAATGAFHRLLSQRGAGRMNSLRSDLRARQLALRCILVVSALFVVVQGFLRPTGQWVLSKEVAAYGIGIAGFWLIGALLGA